MCTIKTRVVFVFFLLLLQRVHNWFVIIKAYRGRGSWCVQTLNGVVTGGCPLPTGLSHCARDIWCVSVRYIPYKYGDERAIYECVCVCCWWPSHFPRQTTNITRIAVRVCASVCGKCACNCEFNELFTFLCACWRHNSTPPQPLPAATPRPWPASTSARVLFFFCHVCLLFLFLLFSLLISFIIRVQN